jgi:membrane protein DedA with SNARE-associated domain
MNEWLQSMLSVAAQDGWPALIALAVATLISEDLACIAGGLMVARGSMAFVPATAACGVGILAGDLLLVVLGRTVGRTSLQLAPLRWWISTEAVRRAERWFARRGASLIFASRFMPGMRLPTYVAAGVLRAPWLTFIGWFVLAGVVWTPLLVGGAVLLGDVALHSFSQWSSAVPALLVAAFFVWLLSKLAVVLSTWRGRRLLLGRWRRLTCWEFWPMWAVYPPVIAYILWLGARYRSFTLPTAVNPGIGNGGGLVGESKSEILRGLAGAGNVVATWQRIPAGTLEDRIHDVNRFMQQEQLPFPIVLKPDVGERGKGVVICRDPAALEATLAGTSVAMIAQRYIPGVEFGVFYFRRPDDPRGEILAITDKRVVSVMGDGRRTFEELILGDDRAVCLAPFFLRTFADRLDTVPAAGERVALSELGTHCRGSLFLDGTHLVTDELRRSVERISRTFEGFNFGRYDVRAASVEAFQRGEFSVIELNGLTSEATSIYDPRHSVWFGWRMLCRQWRIAFEIAAALRARGARPFSVRELWRLFTQPRLAS